MAQPETTTIVAFGDSITEAAQVGLDDRWPEVVRRALQERFPDRRIVMINSGVGGNTTREGLARFDRDVLAHQPDFVTVEFGNDATAEEHRHVSFDEFTANLDRIRREIVEKRHGRVVLLTFPPIIDAWHTWRDHEFYKPSGGLDAYQELYRRLTREFAAGSGLPLTDIDRALRDEMAVHGAGEFILPDGVHLTARGNRVVAQAVFDVLSRAIAGLPRAGTIGRPAAAPRA
jgi:lysophospholipase L1-like esterase